MMTKFPHACEAKYNVQPIAEFVGNPLIEILPTIDSDEAVLRKLRCFPGIHERDRKLPSEIRKVLTRKIQDLVVPLPEYLSMYRMIESALFRSYSRKNPLSPTTTHYLHYIDSSETFVQPYTGKFQPDGCAITLEGESGVGKSHMVKRILSGFDQCVYHSSYKGRTLNFPQIVWVYVDCPDDGSPVSFCKKILYAIDQLVGHDYYDDALRARATKSDLIIKIERAVRNFFIGIIVIDEMSNLEPPKNGHAHPLLSFLLNLINSSGVPFLFVGNPDMRDVFTLTQRVARRVENGGYINMKPLAHATWDIFCRKLWSLQFTNSITPYTGELSEHLRKLSNATPDHASRTFIEAQKCVIGTQNEKITLSALNEGQRRAIALSKDLFINSGVEADLKPYNKILNEIEIGAKQDEDWNDQSAVDNSGVITGTKTVYDPDRSQHPEFAYRINQLLSMSPLPIHNLQPQLMCSIGESDDIVKSLMDYNLILDVPILALSG